MATANVSRTTPPCPTAIQRAVELTTRRRLQIINDQPAGQRWSSRPFPSPARSARDTKPDREDHGCRDQNEHLAAASAAAEQEALRHDCPDEKGAYHRHP